MHRADEKAARFLLVSKFGFRKSTRGDGLRNSFDGSHLWLDCGWGQPGKTRHIG
jgi:hypothetical protein